MTETSTIALLAALPLELTPTLQRLGIRRDAPRRRRPPQRIATSQRAGVTIDAYLSGMGRAHVETCINAMMRERPPHCVIHLGFAGGLNPRLDVGDILEPSALQHPDAHRLALEPLRIPAHAPTGTLLTVDRSLLTPPEKARLHEALGRPDVVDTEAYHAVQRLRDGGAGPIDYVAIRAITDRYDQTVPAAVMHWIDARGRPRPARLAVDLLRQPSLARDARRLRAAATTAAARLAGRVEQRLNEIIEHITA